jgi:hypothetical protein
VGVYEHAPHTNERCHVCLPYTAHSLEAQRLHRGQRLRYEVFEKMLVFIDESGCPGFKFTRGSDPVFGLGMVVFENGEHARATERSILELRTRVRHKPEFKFSKSSDAMRDAFFGAVVNCPFVVRALIVRKDVLYSQHLRAHVDSFYNYFVKMLMAHDGGALKAASVRIDGSGSQEFQRSLGAYLRRELGHRIKDVKMSDSARDPLMQVADMCIGAITRAERDRANACRWREMLAPRIRDIWRFR